MDNGYETPSEPKFDMEGEGVVGSVPEDSAMLLGGTRASPEPTFRPPRRVSYDLLESMCLLRWLRLEHRPRSSRAYISVRDQRNADLM